MKYTSNFSGKETGEAQFIVELICIAKNKKTGSGDLPNKFWNLPAWKAFYRTQIVAAHGLLKIYSANAIVSALKSKDAYAVFSLRAPFLDDIIRREAAKLLKKEQQLENCTETIRKDVNEKPRETFRDEPKKKNILSKLKELD